MHTSPAAKTTQIIAIYCKGGIGKSFTLANLSYMLAQQGNKVLLIGCDPKSDTTSLLFGGKACPTIIETSSKKQLAVEAVAIGDVCFKRDGVYAMELGGPEVGRGCGGRGIIHGFETLEKLGLHDWGFDFVLLDFLGDVVCGGFGLPIARDMCQKVTALVQQLRQRGVTVTMLFLELLTPVARELGALWEDDRVDFATVTVSLGRLQRLQRLQRQLSPDFGNEVQHPAHGRRVLLTQPDTERHMFGLSMVAEFFRRQGWDVLGGVAGVGIDAVAWVRRDWFDAVGFSIGSEQAHPWLRDTIAEVRRVSRNSSLVILVSGPLFSMHPEWAAEIGADATTTGQGAPQIAETILGSRVQEQSGRARMS